MSNKQIVNDYQKVNYDISIRINHLALTIIAAIFIICDKLGVTMWYLAAFLGLVLTLTFQLSSMICFSKHYELVIDEKINNEHFENSGWGRSAENLYWVFILCFFVSAVVFVVAVISSILG